MKKTKSLLILGTLGLMLLGCYPQGPEYVDDLDLVYTNHDDTYDFTSKNTYARPNDIVKITGNLIDQDEDPEYIPGPTAATILAQFDENMTEMGWTKVELDADPAPDVVMLPAALETTTITYWYDYWYGWWGGYYPPGGYYPGYPSYPVVTSYSTGTLVFLIADTDVNEVGNRVIHWSFAANGVLSGSYNVNRVTKAIDQGFKQSPYLKTN